MREEKIQGGREDCIGSFFSLFLLCICEDNLSGSFHSVKRGSRDYAKKRNTEC